ncbi:exodeoxyribonuclease VII small subunit [Helicobacter muridarum]|uniref:Exodeoxyribonuclease VII small subunit n=1 Tax=Helicobacter muridarum TaxID=216 RepID=A0A099U0S6_9HELI|nr:exodeoxyribonuclease VII small subunit [Helicobacter muridarum]TLE00163.1 exodeoxyribonuclease VII small subunit [Helicobacter muridarum]STQ87030.1 exodeoxyribonuclease VII small subunit [Helicobacter muridarum]
MHQNNKVISKISKHSLESLQKQDEALNTNISFDSQNAQDKYQDLQEQDFKEIISKNSNKSKQTQADINQVNYNEANQDSLGFEDRVEKVKLIIEKLNNNELSLKEGIELYQEAKEHLALANEILEQAEFELRDILQ